MRMRTACMPVTERDGGDDDDEMLVMGWCRNSTSIKPGII